MGRDDQWAVDCISSSRLGEGLQGQCWLQRLGTDRPGLLAVNSKEGKESVHSQLALEADMHATWGPWNPRSVWPWPGLP